MIWQWGATELQKLVLGKNWDARNYDTIVLSALRYFCGYNASVLGLGSNQIDHGVCYY